MLNMTLQEPCESMQSDYKSIDTEQNTSETWGFDLCFLYITYASRIVK